MTGAPFVPPPVAGPWAAPGATGLILNGGVSFGPPAIVHANIPFDATAGLLLFAGLAEGHTYGVAFEEVTALDDTLAIEIAPVGAGSSVVAIFFHKNTVGPAVSPIVRQFGTFYVDAPIGAAEFLIDAPPLFTIRAGQGPIDLEVSAITAGGGISAGLVRCYLLDYGADYLAHVGGS